MASGAADGSAGNDGNWLMQRFIPIVLIIVIVILAAVLGQLIYRRYTTANTAAAGYYQTIPGDYKTHFLSGSQYTTLIVEVDYIDGYAPDADSLALLKARLEKYCEKDTIEVRVDDRLSSNVDSYTTDQIEAIESEFRDQWESGTTTTVYVLYLNGYYQDSINAIGVSYRAASFAIFKEQITSIAIPRLLQSQVNHEDFENSVLVHEFGHLFGLVNIGYESTAEHEDPEHENHCVYEECVMYYALETAPRDMIEKWFSIHTVKPPTDFCAACQADLARFQAY